jgi:hypothetical protein
LTSLNTKVAQTLAGHHSAAFTLDAYPVSVPQQLEEAGEAVAAVLQFGSSSESDRSEDCAQVIEIIGAPGQIRTPDLLVS